MSEVIIALGSNLGPSAQTLAAAAQRILELEWIEQQSLSNIYTTKPAIIADQPNFQNAVMLVKTTLAPLDLLHSLQAIEAEFGRVREGDNYVAGGPRTLDLDIIDYEGVVLASEELTLPHPRALHRDFVVTPLLEICPNHVLANGLAVTTRHIDCGEIIDNRLERGLLSVCATPIGNLGDITLRVLDTLRAANTIYCEDTRVTRKLATRFELKAPLRRADSHKLPELLPTILADLAEGKHLAYVSDAGMPGISDPGSLLVAAARQADFAVEVLPGASALTTALTASGLNAHNHYFGGFLPRKTGACTRLLESLGKLEDTVLVFYESVHRTAKSLALIAEVLPQRQVVMARELTKLHEEIASGLAPDLAASIAERIAHGQTLKGEVVILIGAK